MDSNIRQIFGQIFKDMDMARSAAQVPKGRKVEAWSAPQLVTMYRCLYRDMVKAKLLGQESANALTARELYLKGIESEMKRRNIEIQHPELE